MNKLIRDTWLIGKNELIIQVRNPLWLIFGLFQPIIYLILFAPFLSGITRSPGFPGGTAIQFFAPGLLIMNVMFGAGFAGFGLIDQLRTGFIERIRVTPISRLSLVLGLVFRAPIVVLIQSIILIITALFFGLKIQWPGVLLLGALLFVIGATMASLSFTIGLLVRDEGVLAATTNFGTQPLLLLSGVMLPIAFGPKSLQTLAKFNPFAYAVDAARALVNGDLGDPSIVIAFAIFIALGILALAWFIRAMKDAVA